MDTSLLTRVLKVGSYGKDVDGAKRTTYRGLDKLDGGHRLKKHMSQPLKVRRTFGPFFKTDVNRLNKALGLKQDGRFTKDTLHFAAVRDYPDAMAFDLFNQYADEHKPKPAPKLVYPHPKGAASRSGGFVHQTGGIRGNYALDFLCPPGTPVLAPEAGTVSRTSGYDPATGLHGANRDVFGWSVYLRCTGGFYYSTHYGRLTVRAGSKVKAGQIIGYVGDWPHDRGRSHAHLGYTSFTRLSSVSIRKIKAVAAAPRVAVGDV